VGNLAIELAWTETTTASVASKAALSQRHPLTMKVVGM
jgi:hypothetical protein